MQLEFCIITVPKYLETNVLDCPISHCLRKHEIELVFPRPYKIRPKQYVVCFPSETYVNIMRTLEDNEDFKFAWIKTHYSDTDDLQNTYIVNNNMDFILTKAV
jgi:hypothetical protein